MWTSSIHLGRAFARYRSGCQSSHEWTAITPSPHSCHGRKAQLILTVRLRATVGLVNSLGGAFSAINWDGGPAVRPARTDHHGPTANFLEQGYSILSVRPCGFPALAQRRRVLKLTVSDVTTPRQPPQSSAGTFHTQAARRGIIMTVAFPLALAFSLRKLLRTFPAVKRSVWSYVAATYTQGEFPHSRQELTFPNEDADSESGLGIAPGPELWSLNRGVNPRSLEVLPKPVGR